MNTYLYIVQIFVSVVLIGVLLLQARGSGFSATFSSDSSIYRTRRGVEKTLFNVTIVASGSSHECTVVRQALTESFLALLSDAD